MPVFCLTELTPPIRHALAIAGLAALALMVAWIAGPAAALSVGAAGAILAVARRRRPAATRPARLELCERRALGNGGELWLVEVDGRTVLVACGRGFAAIRPLRPGASP